MRYWATYTSKRAGDLDNTFDLPAYWHLDASVGYALSGNIELGGSIENLTGERYYDYAFSEFEVWPGAPRTWKVFARSRF